MQPSGRWPRRHSRDGRNELNHFLIVATPRSGTTFISRAMDHAKATRSVVGNLILPVTCSIHRVSRGRKDRAIVEAIEQGFESEVIRRSQINSRFEAIHRYVNGRQGITATLGDLRGAGFRNFVFKEPFLSVSPSLALGQWVKGIFWIVRDGRDVANSLVNSYDVLTDSDLRRCRSNENPIKTDRMVGDFYIPWWVEDDHVDTFAAAPPYVRAGMMWAFTVRACRAEYAEIAKVHNAKYEELVADPGLCATEISSFLSVPKSRHLAKACRTASPRSIGAHRKRESAEISQLEAVIGDTLSEFGYT